MMGNGGYGIHRTVRSLLQSIRYYRALSRSSFYSQPSSPAVVTADNDNHIKNQKAVTLLNNQKAVTLLRPNSPSSSKPTSSFTFTVVLRNLRTTASQDDVDEGHPVPGKNDEEVEPIDFWEEEDDTEPEIGDGGDGGGVVLQNCPWGEPVLSIAQEVLLQFDDDIQLYAFKTSPRGYIYVRLDKLSNEYGCPSMEEIESYSHRYKQRLDEVGASGEIPDDLALEVSSPSAERLLRVPDDLDRFKNMPMRVTYLDDMEGKSLENNGVFVLDSINAESGTCTWKLANVKENRDPSLKGRPLSRKQKDWRLELPFATLKKVTLYLDY